MNQNEQAANDNQHGHEDAPHMDSGIPAPSHEGTPDSNGRKRYPINDSGATVAEEGALPSDGPADLLRELEEARREAAALKDGWTRERAEFQNYKRRMVQETSRMKTHAVADFMAGLLPVLDNLESVLRVDTDNEAVKQFVSGVAMIHKELIGLLDRHNIRIVRPQGEPFNPESMEAIASEVRDDLDREVVLDVFQDGLVMEFEDGIRQVLRPARVRVGRPSGNTKKEA